MPSAIDRREFLALAGMAGVTFASALPGVARAAGRSAGKDFVFVQMSDTHWGFQGPPNPDAAGTLPKAIAAVNALAHKPDFIVFTGDLTHTTDDDGLRRARLAQFRDLVARLDVKQIHFMPGEHDAALDEGKAFRELFGDTHYTFDHGGVHFIVLDNVSDPTGSFGTAQLAWLRADLARRGREEPIVVLAHRPLFDLYPDWDWATRDGAEAIRALTPFEYATVFYGHIHQEHHHMTGHIAHHAARSLMFGLPAPGSVPKKAPVPWNPAQPYRGLGFRSVETKAGGRKPYGLTEWPVVRG
ncbi:MAG TPA: metallophosphoesterase [Candidatus Binatia bacterium]|nr:metallophosphoesterase [Candidatus Binatia bacterium]